MHNSDGIHPNDLGHRAVGYAIVKALGAPADVSSVNVNASGPSLVSASGATVTATWLGGAAAEECPGLPPADRGTPGELQPGRRA